MLTSPEIRRYECVALGASECFVKPANWAEWQRLIDDLIDWHLS